MKQSIQLFGLPVHPWTMDETVREIERRLIAGKYTQHAVVNVAKIVNVQTDLELRESIIGCDIVNIDGVGLLWGARLLDVDVSERVAGIDLVDRLLDLSAQKGYPVYLLGAKPKVLQKTVTRVQEKYPALKIAGYQHGYFWDDEESVVEEIRDSDALLLFVAISSPKKENFVNRWKGRLGVRFVMGVGGTFDVLAGKVRRAPEWMQKAGLEWLFRVIQEPRRMWKRYFVTNTKFAWMLLKEKLKT